MSVEIVLESTLVSGDHSRPLPEIQQAVQFKLKPFSADNARATTCLTCYTDNAVADHATGMTKGIALLAVIVAVFSACPVAGRRELTFQSSATSIFRESSSTLTTLYSEVPGIMRIIAARLSGRPADAILPAALHFAGTGARAGSFRTRPASR
jgi:hypothetical protein